MKKVIDKQSWKPIAASAMLAATLSPAMEAPLHDFAHVRLVLRE
jgi:hypothetical protein